MNARTNEFGQPIGPPVEGWRAVPRPAAHAIDGSHVRVEALDAERHAGDLFQAFRVQGDEPSWTYLAYGPFETREALAQWLQEFVAAPDSIAFAIVDRRTQRAVGFSSYLRIFPEVGSIEIGNVYFSRGLRGTPAATEAMVLLMSCAFELGYRRYEWKCDALNEPSARAAKRLGFRFEGVFRNAVVYKERSRDTAWYSITEGEWPALQAVYERWLAPENFDDSGQQILSLSSMTATLR